VDVSQIPMLHCLQLSAAPHLCRHLLQGMLSRANASNAGTKPLQMCQQANMRPPHLRQLLLQGMLQHAKGNYC
jgi:hypothetical protein